MAQTAHRTKGPAFLATDPAILLSIGTRVFPPALVQFQVALHLQFLAQDIVLSLHVINERLDPGLQPRTLIEELDT